MKLYKNLGCIGLCQINAENSRVRVNNLMAFNIKDCYIETQSLKLPDYLQTTP